MVPLPICLLQWNIPQYSLCFHQSATVSSGERAMLHLNASVLVRTALPWISGNVLVTDLHVTSSSIEIAVACCYTETTPRVLRDFCFLIPHLRHHIKQVQDWVVISHQIYICINVSDFGILEGWWHWWCWLPHAMLLFYVQILHTGRPFPRYSHRHVTADNEELL